MAQTKPLPVKDLQLDLRNFRTVPQEDEPSALSTMISIAPERFWALAESLLDTGYLPTENIIILADEKGRYHVREGNRRIGALKLIFKYINSTGLTVPIEIQEKIKKLDNNWKDANAFVPCTIYQKKEEALVDKIVTLAHGKGEKAGRDNWTSVARARHNRDKNGASEAGLDLLEKYIGTGKNLTDAERELWSGVYPLSVLDEVAGKIAPRLNFLSSRDLADQYPSIKSRKEIEEILKAIGSEQIKFEHIRDKFTDFASAYGVPPLSQQVTAGVTKNALTTQPLQSAAPANGNSKGIRAVASNDPKSVMLALKQFTPIGRGRNKVVTLLNEARQLKIKKTPHAFCFLLRSMFEISAKAYCADHIADGLTTIEKNGNDKKLVDVLQEIVSHMTAGKKKTDPLCKYLHGAMTELSKPNGLLSITSLNQLIHNPNFVVDETHICTGRRKQKLQSVNEIRRA